MKRFLPALDLKLIARSLAVAATFAVVRSTAAYTYNANDFATTVMSYVSGPVSPLFANSASALGRPTVDTTGDGKSINPAQSVPVVPVFPPFHGNELVSVGLGGSLVLEFSHPVYDDPANPYGVDFTIFGNALQNGSNGYYANGDPAKYSVLSTGYSHPMTVSVSQDGSTWSTITAGPADDFAPTMGRVYNPGNPDTTIGSWNKWWGQPTDPTLPLPPGYSFASFGGQSLATIAQTYGQSAGGASFDIGTVNLPWIQYVRIQVPADSVKTVNIDAVAIVAETQWSAAVDSKWSVNGNWTGAQAPNGPGAIANFKQGPLASGPLAVTLDAAQTVGSLNFANSAGYTLSGTQTLTIQASPSGGTGGSGAAITVSSGSHTISAPIAFASPVTITVTPAASTLTLSGPLTTAGQALTIAGQGSVVLPALGTGGAGPLTISSGKVQLLASSGLSQITSLSLSGGTLDLNNNALQDTTDALDTITAAIRGKTLFSSSTAGDKGDLAVTGLAAVRGADFLDARGSAAKFYDHAVSRRDILVKYTYIGDTNLDGKITADDYLALDVGYLFNLSGWSHGDFTYAGAVSAEDYALIDESLRDQGNALAEGMIALHTAWFGPEYLADLGSLPVSVPEPGALGLLLAGVGAVMLRRKR